MPETRDELRARLAAIGLFTPMQITPTFDDHELLTHPVDPAAPIQPLINHGGRTITAAQVINVYLDTFPDNQTDFDAFTKAIIENGYYRSPDGSDTANGKFLGSYNLASGLSGTVNVSQLEAFLAAHVGKELPAANQNLQFVLILPPTLQAQFDDGSGASCTAWCGFHSRASSGIYYTVLADPGCSGCHGGSITPQQGRMMVQSHEYGEWRSDPDGNAWYSAQGEENGDECAWIPVAWGPQKQWTVQPLACSINGAWQCYTAPWAAGSQPPPTQYSVALSGPLAPTVGTTATYAAALTPAAANATYAWIVNNQVQPATSASLSVPLTAAGVLNITCTATVGTQQASASLVVQVQAAQPPPSGCRSVVDARIAYLDGWLAGQEKSDPQFFGYYAYAKSIVDWLKSDLDGRLPA